jgi:hypothetical protein
MLRRSAWRFGYEPTTTADDTEVDGAAKAMGTHMKAEYDFSKLKWRKNPYASRQRKTTPVLPSPHDRLVHLLIC